MELTFPKLNLVLRTCDRVSIQQDRLVPKDECIYRCLRSLVASLAQYQHEWHLHIIDDNSSDVTKEKIQTIAPMASFDFLPERDQTGLDARQKSRFSVAKQYHYVDSIARDELVYLVEDDYLHYPDTITAMLTAWQYFTSLNPNHRIGIFPQDFKQLYFHPENPYNETYIKPCVVLPGPDRYYRTTWYTHESFMIPKSVIEDYRPYFDELQKIGYDYRYWEGNTLSNVWEKPDVTMVMPMRTLAVHLGKLSDISFFVTDAEQLWMSYAE